LWREITGQYVNVLFLQGNYLCLEDIAHLQVESAYKILILSLNSDGFIQDFEDSRALCFAKIIEDHY
jgi:hypothetical protein